MNRIVAGFLLYLGAGCGGLADADLDLGEPDPSVTRAGPASRPGSPAGAQSDAPYEPGDRVDLGSADAVLLGPDFTQAGVTVAMPGDMDGDGLAEIAVANSLLQVDHSGRVGRVRHGVHLVYGAADLDPEGSLDDADVTLLTPWIGGGGGDQPWLSPAGDVDGDGLADLLVGFPGDCDVVGRTYLVYGQPVRPSGTLLLQDVATELTDGVACGRFGARVSGIGDVNGDGRGDFAVSAFGGRDDPSTSAAHVFYGSRSRLESGASADAVLRGLAGELVGLRLAAAGNVDQDQYDDFLVGVSARLGASGVYLVRGSNVRLVGDVALDEVAPKLEVGATDFGALGDLDDDGLDDFGVGTHGEVAVHLFHGDLTLYRDRFTVEEASAQLEGEEPNSWMSIAAAGDTNGDGASDFLVGLSSARDQRGAVHLVLGDGSRWTGAADLSARAVTFIGRATAAERGLVVFDGAGGSIGAGHDINGDGLDDFIVGASGNAIGDATGGRVYVVLGIAAAP